MKSDKTLRSTILERALRYAETTGTHPTPLSTLWVIRRDGKTEAVPGTYSPSVCLVLQGEKVAWAGDRMYRYDSANYLVSGVDLPATAQITSATPSRPFICLKLELQPSIVYDILQETTRGAGRMTQKTSALIYVDEVDAVLRDAFDRLLRTLDDPNELGILSPLIVREIHYRLMSSRFGSKVQQLGVIGSSTQRIVKAIERLRMDYAMPLRIVDLAELVNMSPSSFHHHFRQVTHMSPLQYQKQLRLQEARRLLSIETTDAASVAFQVGYESPSQFSREYRRLFGESPIRDKERLRMLVPMD